MEFDQRFVKFLLVGLILAASLSYIVVSELKLVFQVPRPCAGLPTCDTDFSFPSRHTGIAFAMAATFSLYMRKKVYWAVSLVAAGLVAYWRVAIGDHTVVDVFGGAVVGIALGFVVYYILKRFHKIKGRQ